MSPLPKEHQNTAGFTKTVPSVYTLVILQVAEGTFFKKHTGVFHMNGSLITRVYTERTVFMTLSVLQPHIFRNSVFVLLQLSM